MPFSDGRKAVAAAGTAEPLVEDEQASAASVVITAATENTGAIVVGGETVVADEATRRGHPLDAGESIRFTQADDDLDDLSGIYLDAEVDGEAVTWVASTSD